MFRYTLLRTLIFLGCLLLLWLLGLRDRDEMVMLVVGSALISMVISWFGLRRMREEYSAQLAARLEREPASRGQRRSCRGRRGRVGAGGRQRARDLSLKGRHGDAEGDQSGIADLGHAGAGQHRDEARAAGS